MERNTPRNKTRSNPDMLPRTRLECRCKKRSMTALLMTFAQNIMKETAMERHSFWLRPRRAALHSSDEWVNHADHAIILAIRLILGIEYCRSGCFCRLYN